MSQAISDISSQLSTSGRSGQQEQGLIEQLFRGGKLLLGEQLRKTSPELVNRLLPGPEAQIDLQQARQDILIQRLRALLGVEELELGRAGLKEDITARKQRETRLSQPKPILFGKAVKARIERTPALFERSQEDKEGTMKESIAREKIDRSNVIQPVKDIQHAILDANRVIEILDKKVGRKFKRDKITGETVFKNKSVQKSFLEILINAIGMDIFKDLDTVGLLDLVINSEFKVILPDIDVETIRRKLTGTKLPIAPPQRPALSTGRRPFRLSDVAQEESRQAITGPTGRPSQQFRRGGR